MEGIGDQRYDEIGSCDFSVECVVVCDIEGDGTGILDA